MPPSPFERQTGTIRSWTFSYSDLDKPNDSGIHIAPPPPRQPPHEHTPVHRAHEMGIERPRLADQDGRGGSPCVRCFGDDGRRWADKSRATG
jgi:hypothetical protein